jgi:ribosomal protein L34E
MADGSDTDAADGHANDLRCTHCGVKADALVIQRGRTEYDLASCVRRPTDLMTGFLCSICDADVAMTA